MCVSGEHHCSHAIWCSLASCKCGAHASSGQTVLIPADIPHTKSVAADNQQLLHEITPSNAFKINSRNLNQHQEQSDSVLGGGKEKI